MRPPNEVDQISRAIARLTGLTVGYRLVLENERKFKMSRLSEKLTKAAGVAGRQTVKIEARADSLIAREAVIESKTEQAFAPHEALLSDAEKGLDVVERSLALLSNDPLASSGSSPEVEQPAALVFQYK
jgi:hypothetical protein